MAGKSGSQAGPDLACFPKDEEDIVDHFPVLSRSCDDISRRSASGSRMLHRQGTEGDRKPRPAPLRLWAMPSLFSVLPNAPSLTPTTFSWQRHSLLDGFGTSLERTFPSILPNAVSWPLRFACGLRHSSCAVSGLVSAKFVTSEDVRGVERMAQQVLRVRRWLGRCEPVLT
jgi:hypothetical protein